MKKLPLLDRIKQRARLYGGRSAKSALRRPLKRRCMYMHVPKCGGTSVSEGLYATVPLQDRIGLLPSPEIRQSQSFYYTGAIDLARFHDEGPETESLATFREQLVLLRMSEDCSLIHGHFLYTPRIRDCARQNGYDPVTILRDPIARTISNFRMAERNGMATDGLDAFLDSEMGRRMAQHALRYFSGRADIGTGEIDAALGDAKSNMEDFVLIGFLDDLDGFAQGYAKHFGNRPRFAHLNSGGSSARSDITADQRRKLETLCAPDIVLTDLARELMRRGQ